MCTAATYKTKDFYFGRTLDHVCSYSEEVTITPRNFPLPFRAAATMEKHYAMLGMAHVADDYPLYFDAVNEKGLAMAGLNFVGYAHYGEPSAHRENIAHFEFIPWVMAQCASVKEAADRIEKINLTNTPFSAELPPSQLHWIIADHNDAIAVESVKDGIRIYPNPVGVLTNNPPFNQQLLHLNDYMHLSPRPPHNHFSEKLSLHAYSLGMGALGLPGDLSSQSRFVRAAFVKMNSFSGSSESKSVSQFFHILGSVDQPRGCCMVGEEKCETTIYTSCCNTDKGIYYYTTYDNHQISAVNMHKEKLDDRFLIRYPLASEEQIFFRN